MKQISIKIIPFILLLFVVFSCKKNETIQNVADKQIVTNDSKHMADSYRLTNETRKINFMFYKTYPYVQSTESTPKSGKSNVTINKNQVPVFATVNGYQVGYNCAGGQELNFPDIITSLNGGAVGDPTIPVLVNGSLYNAQFTYAVFNGNSWNENHYTLLHVPISSGYLCNNPDIYFEFYSQLEILYQSIATSENTCNVNGSWNPYAYSPASGSLNFALLFTLCNPACPLALPANYRFRYRIQGTTIWTSFLVDQAHYYNNFTTVTGLTPGSYEVEGRNECAGVAPSPYSACQFNPIQVN